MKRFLSLSQFTQGACLLACAALLLTACSKATEFEYIDEVVTSDDDEPTVVVTDENGNETTLPEGAMIGIYVIDSDGNVTLLQVEVDENGNAVLPTTNQGETIIAYTPYQEEWGDSALMTMPAFTVESNQTTEELYRASDLMIGISGQHTRAAEAPMRFIHMLSKVAIHVVDETGRVKLESISAELLNVNNSVTVDLMHQHVSTIDSLRASISMLSEMTTDWRISSYAIVAPQFIGEGTTFFAITLYGNRQLYPIPQASQLEGGKTYTINMRLTEHGLILDGWYITDWDDTTENDIDVKV